LNAESPEIGPDQSDASTGLTHVRSDGGDPLEALAAEFLDGLRRGEPVDVSELLARASDRAGELGELLSALCLVEGVRPQFDSTSPTAKAGLPQPELAVERLGDFRILRELGRGGMGVVYEAEQESLGRQVALKVLSQNTARSPHILQRFLREARAAAQLHHTNIVPVFGVGERAGLHYYAMQFIRGLSLDKVLEEVRQLKGLAPAQTGEAQAASQASQRDTSVAQSLAAGSFAGLPQLDRVQTDSADHPALAAATDSDARYARSVARIGLQVAEALEYAHQQGTLHRDIKPSNILLDINGVAWVTDFGLAKAVEDEDLTRTGDLVGTLRYMAPERFRGRCDGRSDQYGLGLTLYELLALRPAFSAMDRESLLYQVSQVELDRLRLLNPAIPVDLETIIHKAVEKNPDDRYKRPAELAADLKCFLEDRPIAARRVSSTERLTRWARRNPGLATLGTALAAMLAFVVVIMVVADLRLRRQHEATVENLRRAELAERVASTKLFDSYVANARAGRRSRFAGQRFDGLTAIRAAARLDRRGSRVLELRNEAIACLALPDVRPIDVWADGPQGGFLGVDFDPNTRAMARGTPQGDVLIRGLLESGDDIRLHGVHALRTVMVRFSRDGRYIAVKHQELRTVVLVVWDVRRAEKLLVIPDGMEADAVDFHPDGRTFAAGQRDGSIVLYDLDRRRQVKRFNPGPVPQSIRFDAKGERLAIASPTTRDSVYVRDAKDGSITTRWGFSDRAYSVDWHPDGLTLAFGDEAGKIRLLNSRDVSRPPRTISAHDGAVVALAFHPDGGMLASGSWDGTMRVWDVGTARQLVRCPMPEARPLRFTGDGRLLGPAIEGASAWIWEVAQGVECRSLVGVGSGGAWTRALEFLPETDVLASGGEYGVWLEVPDSAVSAFLDLPGTEGVASTPDGSWLITSGTTGLLRWPVRYSSGHEMHVGPPDPLGHWAGFPSGRLRIARDGHTLAVVYDGELGDVVVADLNERERPVSLTGHTNLERLDLSLDGRWAATGTWRGTGVKVWDVGRGTLIKDLAVEGSADAFFSPDSRMLLTASGDEYAGWNVGSWTPRVRIPRHQATGMPGQAAFSPDGAVMAIAKTRSLMQLIDSESGQELASLESFDPRNVSALRFNQDGRLLAVGSAGVQVWKVDEIHRELEPLRLAWPTPRVAAAVNRAGANTKRIVVHEASWQRPLLRGEELARAGRWDEASAAFETAINFGARHFDAHAARVLLRRARGDQPGYAEACRQLLRDFGAAEFAAQVANDVAWACSLGSGAIEDYRQVIHLAELALASRPSSSRQSTLGAVLYRAGRYEEAIPHLSRSVELQAADSPRHHAFFLAMAHHRLGHEKEARHWLRLATPGDPVSPDKPAARGDTSWIRTLEFEILQREASALIEPTSR
jgi:serine/threonine protein kinase/WD40 repeat protein